MERDFFISAFRNVRRRLRSRHEDDDEDALQDAFCRLWTRRDEFSSMSQAEGFLTVAARNLIIDRHRHNASHPQTDLENVDPSCLIDDENDSPRQLISEISRLIDSHLSPRDRDILHRRDRDGWEFDEIAEYFEISEMNARTIVSRARKTIRELYRKRQQS